MSKQRTKRVVLNENKEAFRRIIAIKQHEQQQLDDKITSHLTPDTATKVRSHRYLAHNTASKRHNEKFQHLLENLHKSTNIASTEEPQNATEPEDTTEPETSPETKLT